MRWAMRHAHGSARATAMRSPPSFKDPARARREDYLRRVASLTDVDSFMMIARIAAKSLGS